MEKIKVSYTERLKNYKGYISPANVLAEPYLMLREKCKEDGLSITRVMGVLCDLYVKGDVEINA